MLFNVTDSTGLLIDRLKKRRQAIKVQAKRENRHPDVRADAVDRLEYTEEEAKEDFLYLKTTEVNAQTLAEFQEKLRKTVGYRTNLLSDDSIDMMENFPYFFTHPQLVNIILFSKLQLRPNLAFHLKHN